MFGSYGCNVFIKFVAHRKQILFVVQKEPRVCAQRGKSVLIVSIMRKTVHCAAKFRVFRRFGDTVA